MTATMVVGGTFVVEGADRATEVVDAESDVGTVVVDLVVDDFGRLVDVEVPVPTCCRKRFKVVTEVTADA